MPAKVHLVLGVRINHLPQQLCCHPLPQPSKELHGVISALGNAQGLCPEWETPCSHLPQRNTTGKPRALLGQAGPLLTTSSSEPVPAVGQLSQGCLTPCQATAEAALAHSQDQSPQLLCPSPCSLPSHAGSTDRSRASSCPGRAGGVSNAMTGTVTVEGTRLPWYQHEHEWWL